MNKEELRELALVRDHYTCTGCGRRLLSKEERRGFPYVHHINGDKRNNDLSNLTSLCQGCHDRDNSKYSLGRSSRIVKFHSLSEGKDTVSFSEENTGLLGVSPHRVALALGISPKTLYRWIERGWVSPRRLPSGRFRISREEFTRLKELLSGKADSESQ